MTRQVGERGSAAMLVAAALLLLIAFASLAVDAGLGYDERRDLQNAADNAAWAAAYEDCSPKNTSLPNPVKAARLIAAENGFDNADPNITVTAAEDPLAPGTWTVDILVADVDNRFGAATPYAADTFDISVSATARCEPNPFLGGYAVFAGASNCPLPELDISGSDIEINGSIHSNSDVKITGSSPDVNGSITYVPPGGANIPAALSASTTVNQTYPLDPAIYYEYVPGGIRSTRAGYVAYTGNVTNARLHSPTIPDIVDWGDGDNNTMTFTRSGIIYTDGNITLKGVSMDPGVSVTFVAAGEISIIANGDIRGYDPIESGISTKMTALSWKVVPRTCSPGPASAVDVTTSGFAWQGLIFAPNGLVSFSSGTATATLNGSIIAYTVNLSGSNLTVTYDDSANADPEYILDLLR